MGIYHIELITAANNIVTVKIIIKIEELLCRFEAIDFFKTSLIILKTFMDHYLIFLEQFRLLKIAYPNYHQLNSSQTTTTLYYLR